MREPPFEPVPEAERPPKTPPMLVNEIARLFGGKMRKYEIGGVMSQESARLLMRVLAFSDGESQLRLTEITHLKAPTVSVTLKKMEEEGLVRRESDPEDLRVIRVYLTEQGATYNRTILGRLQEVDAILMQGFSEEETDVLRKLLERMRNNILSSEKKSHAETKKLTDGNS